MPERGLEIMYLNINDGEKWSRIFYFEIQQAPSELLLPSAKRSAPESAELALHVSRNL